MRRSLSPRGGRDRGFTLIELALVVTLMGILVSLAVWRMDAYLVGNRVNAAARELIVRLRSAGAIAARANVPIEVAFVNEGADGCVPRYEIRDGAGQLYDRICIADAYPGVGLTAGILAGTPMGCTDDLAPPLPVCSLCDDDAVVTFFTTGEVETSGANVEGDSIVFAAAADPATSRMVAVGVRNVNGRVRVYRPETNDAGWTCP